MNIEFRHLPIAEQYKYCVTGQNFTENDKIQIWSWFRGPMNIDNRHIKCMYEYGEMAYNTEQHAVVTTREIDVKHNIRLQEPVMNELRIKELKSLTEKQIRTGAVFQKLYQLDKSFRVIYNCRQYMTHKDILRNLKETINIREIEFIHNGLLELNLVYDCKRENEIIDNLYRDYCDLKANILKETKISSESQERINEIFNAANNNQDNSNNYNLIDLSVDAIKLPFKLLFNLFDVIDDILGI